MPSEEAIMKMKMLEEAAEERKQHIETVGKQLEDMTHLKNCLEALENEKNKEILANLGRGVFLNSKVNDNKVFVNVGSKVLVRKTFKEAVEIIDRQISGLSELKASLSEGIDKINHELYHLLEDIQKEEKE